MAIDTIVTEMPEVRYYRDRGEAMKRFLRRFRHEISTPLSGAALHLEVAARRLQKDDFDRAALVENLKVCQQAIERASQMLDWISELSHGPDERPREHKLASLLRQSAEPFREDLRRRGLDLELPPDSESPCWFGSAHEIGDLISEITANAFQHATSPGTVRWTIGGDANVPIIVCESPGALPEGDPEHLFGSAKGPASAGRGFGLLRARRLAHANGAELTLAQTNATVSARIRFVAESG